MSTTPTLDPITVAPPASTEGGLPTPPSTQNVPPPVPTSTVPVVPTASPATPVMTGTGLSSIAQPAKVPPPITPTGMPGLQGQVDGTLNPDLAMTPEQLAARTAATGSATGSSLQSLIDEMSNKQSTATATQKAYSDTSGGTGSVYGDEANVNHVQNQIDAEKVASQARIAAITKNSNGMFGGAVADQVKAEQDASTARQANLAVILSAAKGDYTAAKQLADASVAASTQEQENKISALQTIYNNNKSLFSTAESEEFSAAQAARTAALADRRSTQTTINDLAITALKAGASAAVAQKIQAATSISDAERAAAGYLKAPKEAPGQTQTEKDSAAVGTALTDAYSAINQGADPNSVRQAFLTKHPKAAGDWNNYFTDTTSATSKLTYPTPSTAGAGGGGFGGFISSLFGGK